MAISVARFVQVSLPPAPAKILEVGCGDGWLCRELAQAGYDAVGIDPEAPRHSLLRGVGLDDFDSERPFDAVVAVLSLHHIGDVRQAVHRIARLLDSSGSIVVVEFGWDRLDPATLRWCLAHLDRHSGTRSWLRDLCDAVRHALAEGTASDVDACVRSWAVERGYCSSATMLDALDSRFVGDPPVWGPYLYPDLDNVTDDDEREAIAAGRIAVTSFRYVGTARTDRDQQTE